MLVIGENINASNRFVAEAIASRDRQFLQNLARAQAAAEADFIDVNAGTEHGSWEYQMATMEWLVEVVQEVTDRPLAIDSDILGVIEAALRIYRGERLIINSVTKNMDIKRSASFIKKYGHIALAFTPMDLNQARELNRKLYEFLPKEQIIMDTTTAALGYGLDYAFTTMERARLNALKGDTELQHPMCSGTTNAWAAREAWMKMGPEWEPRELRGPIWETVTALTLLLAGVDLFMMMHPAAVKTVKEVVNELKGGRGAGRPEKIAGWVTLKI